MNFGDISLMMIKKGVGRFFASITIPILIYTISVLVLSGCTTTQTQQTTKNKSIKIALIKYEMARNIILHKDYKNLAQAFRYLDDAKKVLKDDPRVYYMTAIAYQLRGNAKKYEEYLKKTIKINKNFFDAYNALGIYYFQENKYRKSIDIFTKLINNPLYTNTDVAFYNRALVFLALKKPKKAEDDFKNAVIFSNYSNPIYIQSLINLQISQKEYIKALKNIVLAESHTGNLCSIEIKKAFCLWKLKNTKQAIDVLNKISDASPGCMQHKLKLLKEIENDINANN